MIQLLVMGCYLLQVSVSGVKQSVHIQVRKGGATAGTDVGSTVLDL